MTLAKNRNPAPLIIKSETIGPPLPGQAILHTFVRQARVLFTASNNTIPQAGVLLQSFSLHDETGTVIIAGALLPASVAAAVFGTSFSLALAGPEQIRVPFFQPNVLDGTWPKDCYAEKGWTLRVNSIGVLALRSLIATVQFIQDDGYRN